MHVCFVSREYPPNAMGGIGTYIVNMTRVLVDAGHQVSVVTRWHPSVGHAVGFSRPIRSEGGRLRVIYIPFADENWRVDARCAAGVAGRLASLDVAAVFGYELAHGLMRFVLEQAVDVIEAPEYEYPAYYYGLVRHVQPAQISARLCRVPVVVHLHSPSLNIFRENDEYIASPWQRFRCLHEKGSIRYADAVVSPSRYLADQVTPWADICRERLRVIPYPLGERLTPGTPRQPKRNRFLFVGRVEPRKGVFEYIEAAVQHARMHPAAEYHFVGGPHTRSGTGSKQTTQSIVESFIPAAVRGQFHFQGPISRDRLAEHYAEAGWCVIPSRWDNYPNTCMEAMSLGRPVVVSDRGGQAELVEDGISGIVCGGGRDHGSLVRGLLAGLQRASGFDAERADRMGAAALRRVLDVCDNRRTMQARLDFYREAIDAVRIRAEAEPREQSKVFVGVFNSGHDAPGTVKRTVNNVRQANGANLIVATSTPMPSLAAERVRVYEILPEDRLPAEGLRKGWWSHALEAEIGDQADVLVAFLSPGVRLRTEFFSAARHIMHHFPRVAFCTAWADAGESARHQPWFSAEVDEDALLRDQAHFPVSGLFRWSAVNEVGGLDGKGSVFADILRDLQLRLLEFGHWCLAVPAPMIAGYTPPGYSSLACFGFHDEIDSQREIMQDRLQLADLTTWAKQAESTPDLPCRLSAFLRSAPWLRRVWRSTRK